MLKNTLKIFTFSFLLIACFMTIKAQDETPTAPTANQTKRKPLLDRLNLTQVQIQQIRDINRRNRPLMRDASQRLKAANRSLDEAVYNDLLDEADIQLKIKEVHAAHAEVIKLRTQNELAVRKILSREQLARFREIREQEMAEKDALPRLPNNRQMNNPNRPANNPLRQNRPLN